MASQLDKIERTLGTLTDFSDLHRNKLVSLDEKLEAITHQLGLLSENLVRLENVSERILDTAQNMLRK